MPQALQEAEGDGHCVLYAPPVQVQEGDHDYWQGNAGERQVQGALGSAGRGGDVSQARVLYGAG